MVESPQWMSAAQPSCRGGWHWYSPWGWTVHPFKGTVEILTWQSSIDHSCAWVESPFVQRIFLLWWWQTTLFLAMEKKPVQISAYFTLFRFFPALNSINSTWSRNWIDDGKRDISNYPYDWLFLKMILVKSSTQKFFSCWLGWPNPHIQPTKDGQEKVSSIDRFAPGNCCSEKLCGENYFLSSVWLVQVRIRCWLNPPMLVYVLRCLIFLGKIGWHTIFQANSHLILIALKKNPLVTLVIPQNGDFNGTIIHKWWNFHGARGYLCFYWGLIHRKLKPGDVCHVAKSPWFGIIKTPLLFHWKDGILKSMDPQIVGVSPV